MKNEISLTILIEDGPSQSGILTEHGLSLWIEYQGRKILFDTGQTDSIIQNAKTLGIHLEETHAIVISHGHYDHTGGLSSVLQYAADSLIYMHPAALEPKYSRKAIGINYIGMSDAVKKSINHQNVIWTIGPTKIIPGISVTGQIPRTDKSEDVGGDFFNDRLCRNPDQLLDDQSLIIDSSKGLIIIFGCAHAGVVNTLNYIHNIMKDKKIYAVIGGMHLLNAAPDRIAYTVEVFQKYGIQKFFPLHCTGRSAIDTLKCAFGEQCILMHAGQDIHL
jgi:7,8-dihydropterin-6-yl-methyl-4-(beta-D-ribofuranosyl)aminobenzene 5'-phosphate synthase